MLASAGCVQAFSSGESGTTIWRAPSSFGRVLGKFKGTSPVAAQPRSLLCLQTQEHLRQVPFNTCSTASCPDTACRRLSAKQLSALCSWERTTREAPATPLIGERGCTPPSACKAQRRMLLTLHSTLDRRALFVRGAVAATRR